MKFLHLILFAVTSGFLSGEPCTANAQTLAFVDRPGLGVDFVTLIECESIQSFGISTTITTKEGERFRIPSQFVREQIALPKPSDSKNNIEKVISQLKEMRGKYTRADREIDLIAARLEQQAKEAINMPATTAPVGPQLTDNSGHTYKNVAIRKVEPDGLIVSHSGGVKKIPFTELSEEIQAKYGYDPTQAKKFAMEQAAIQAAARKQAMDQSRIREEQAKRERQMAAERASAIRIHFEITQVLDDGLLIWNLEDQKTEFLRVNPDLFDVADGEKYNALVIPKGTYNYTSVLGVGKRVREWKFVP